MSFKTFLNERDTTPVKKESKGVDPYNTAKKRVPLRVRAMKLAQKSGVDPRNSADAQAKKYKQVYRDNPGVKEETMNEREVVNEVKEGDHVHLGFGAKGGAGFRGKVTKVDGDTVHVKEHEPTGDSLGGGKHYKEWSGHKNKITVEEIVNEKITDSKESLQKAIAAAERRAAHAKAEQEKKRDTSYIEALKSALRRIKGKKKLSAKDVGSQAVTSEETEEKKKCTKCGTMFIPTYGEHARCPSCLSKAHAAAEKATHVEETDRHEPSHKEDGKVKRAARFKYKKKFDKQNESTEKVIPLLTELSKKVLGSYRKKALGQLKAGKGKLTGKEEKRFNGVAKSVRE